MALKNVFISESAVSSNASISAKNPNTIEFIAVLQEADTPNRNGRIYPKEALERALQAPQIQERLRNLNFFIEAGHPPADASIARQTSINPKNIAAIVKELWWEGNLLKGRIQTADTAIGRDMKGLIEQGSRVAFSLRAQASLGRDHVTGKQVVQDPINIVTYDWVVNPSHEKAYLESIAETTRDFLFNRSGVQTLTESAILYENGRVFEESEEVVVEEINYLRFSNKKVKMLNEMYRFNPEDSMVVSNGIALIESADGTKRMKTTVADYALKDIRHKLRNL